MQVGKCVGASLAEREVDICENVRRGSASLVERRIRKYSCNDDFVKFVIRKKSLCPGRDLNWGLQHWEPGALPSCYRKGVDWASHACVASVGAN